MKKILWGSVGLVFLLAGCQSNTTKKEEANKTPEQKVTMAVNQELSSLDSTLATDTYSITVLNNVIEGLYRLDENNQLVPASAKDVPTVSDDKLTYTINLRDNLEWSNGDKVTADDFVYGWQKAVNPDTGSEYSGLFAGIKNATEIIEGKLPETDLGIKAVDETTIEVTMERPVPYFESLLAFPTFFPQNKAFVEKEGKQY
ncbi:ABC transporter substrate-binding protein [Vagococcus fluvialis]|uniref:ABC transporter substrate-binding protein n=1 Tax=Vagococcus fluvialis TaxID=2738 RepID=UPI003B22558A